MKTIFKYSIPIKDFFSISLPLGSKILTVQIQQNNPYIWVLQDTNYSFSKCKGFRLFGTGHEIDEDKWDTCNYVGTFQMKDGHEVWYLFVE